MIRGDIDVMRRGIFGLRVDEGLNAELLAANKALNKYSKKTQSLNAGGTNRDISLPDAMTLDLGWEIIIHNSGTSGRLRVTNFSGTLLKEIRPVPPANDTVVYAFQLRDNTTQNGQWIVKELGDAGLDDEESAFRATTSDAVITDLMMIPVKTNSIAQLEIRVVGRKESGTGVANIGDGVAYIKHLRVKNISDGVTVHSLQSTFTSKDSPVSAWNLLVDVFGTNIRVRVQGSVDNNINWEGYFFEQSL